MREIKFRAWDKLKSEMIYSGIEYELRRLSNPKYDKGHESDTIGFINNNESYFDIEQYTGLKDKNGKEIYEGDILKHHGIVAWNDVEHRWSVIDLNWNDKREWHDIDYLTSPFEIIGNIHTNLELIK